MSSFETVIGLEVHVQLATETKLFCSCPTTFGMPPNSQVCPVCLGLPGALPVINQHAFELAVQAGLALGCEIATHTKFDRKNYYYPDLPKNYQISQYDMPFASGGRVMIDLEDGTTREINLVRIHLEEDAGKMIHHKGKRSQVDLNRTGTPLLEIVSQPELHGAREAGQYLRELKMILQYLEVSDCNMEEGSLRCDCNVSVRAVGEEALGTKTEIKNLNSFKAVEKAIEYESVRQWERVSAGEEVIHETMLWNEQSGRTEVMRAKEAVHDYRYFPEPDLGPIRIGREYIAQLREQLTELPRSRRDRFVRRYALPPKDAALLCQVRALSDFCEDVISACRKADPKEVSNWIATTVLRHLNEEKIEIGEYPLSAGELAALIDLVSTGRLNQQMGKDVLKQMLQTGRSAGELAVEMGERISGEEAISELCEQAMAENPNLVEAYRGGKTSVLNALIGQVMKLSRGKADAKKAEKILQKML